MNPMTKNWVKKIIFIFYIFKFIQWMDCVKFGKIDWTKIIIEKRYLI